MGELVGVGTGSRDLKALLPSETVLVLCCLLCVLQDKETSRVLAFYTFNILDVTIFI